MTDLLARVRPEGHYAIQVDRRFRSPLKLFAPHGGCIEPCTGNLVSEIAGGVVDYFIFQGMMKKDCFRNLHITSTHYDEPQSRSMADEAAVAIAFHGCDGEETFVEIGGGNLEHSAQLIQVLMEGGIPVRTAEGHRKGEDTNNFINRARFGGIQIECSAGFRRSLFPSYPKSLQRHPTALPAFVDTMRGWLETLNASLQKSEPIVGGAPVSK